MEQRLVHCAAAVVAGEPVEVAGRGQQIEYGRDGGTSRVEVGAFGAIELSVQAGLLVADAA
ncbi:hypothetical protein J5X84_40430 [Streptosporangiaceae bacterium NEAU-GS5]|nr:hypothetical protein [Streptosporangiaceae bacterium NEAU-GS5]